MNGSKSRSNIETIDYDKLKELCESGEKLFYNQMCEKLNIPVLAGSSKIKQMRELTGICKYEKIGRKYIIKELCDREVIDLFNNRSIYIPYIQILLSQEFEKYNKDELYFSIRELMEKLGTFNHNFKAVSGRDSYYKCDIISKKYNINNGNLYKFVTKGYNSVLKPIIKSALNSMQNSRSIDLITGYKTYKYYDTESYKGFIYTYTNINEPLGKEIFSIEGKCMSEMGIKGANELYGSKVYLQDDYYNNCNQRLKDNYNTELYKNNNWDFDGFYRCYLIIINKKRLAYNINEIKKEFNYLIQDRMRRTQTFNFLMGSELDNFIKMMIDIEQKDYNFEKDIKKYEDKFNKMIEIS